MIPPLKIMLHNLATLCRLTQPPTEVIHNLAMLRMLCQDLWGVAGLSGLLSCDGLKKG